MPESQHETNPLEKNNSLQHTQVNFNANLVQKREKELLSPDSARMPFHEKINQERDQSSVPPRSSNLLQQRGASLEPLNNIPKKKFVGDSLNTSKHLATPSSAQTQIRHVSDIDTKELLSSMVGQ